MPVGTQGTVKSVDSQDLDRLGAQIVLGNTYHLFLRPGVEVVKKLGGIHQLMCWDKPMLTDSGGFQVSSMRSLAKIDEDGVTFISHLDGSKKRLTPESSMTIQEQLGADIIMAFDEATPKTSKRYAHKAMERTHRWLDRSIERWQRLEAKKKPSFKPQTLFGIIQGGNYQDLRRISAEYIVEKNLAGVAIGGGTIGSKIEETVTNIGWVRDLIPNEVPFYAMGLGTKPSEVIAAIQAGVDMFDCVAPTRWARTGYLYHGQLKIPGQNVNKAKFVSSYAHERLPINHSRFKNDPLPIEAGCDCYTCRCGYSRAYLHHLFRCKELAYYRLASIHNLRVMIRVVTELRQAIGGKRG